MWHPTEVVSDRSHDFIFLFEYRYNNLFLFTRHRNVLLLKKNMLVLRGTYLLIKIIHRDRLYNYINKSSSINVTMFFLYWGGDIWSGEQHVVFIVPHIQYNTGTSSLFLFIYFVLVNLFALIYFTKLHDII